ncbi:MAG: bifunctional aspartate kinase/homoserine dehydrogenase I [Cyclobacteriaceae bacterium]|nr:bifunctional aspartate kinase/homoserine dehydrogenase I [Cyclobacteriaceae bacterium]
MKVLKFGGTSVGSPESIRQVVEIIGDYRRKNKKIIVVSSAVSGITNLLIDTGLKAAANDSTYLDNLKIIENRHFDIVKALMDIKKRGEVLAEVKRLLNELEDLTHGVLLLKELSPRTQDLLLSFGERLSCRIIAAYARQQGVEATYLDARKLIKTDNNFGKARVLREPTIQNIRNHFSAVSDVQIVTGFISSTERGGTTTLGRGGSDYTAAIIGAALDCEEIEIWTDVDGVMTSDPRKVKKAFSLSELSYVEAMEMSHFGAKVIYPPTIHPALERKIPLRIRNTFNPVFPGTLIHEVANVGDYLIKGISSINNISLINLQGSGMVGVPGVSYRLFGALAKNEISVILITQASSEHSICFAIEPKDADIAVKAITEEFSNEINVGKIDPVKVEQRLSIVAIIGENMRNTPGIAGKMFDSLGKNGINVVAIAQGSSELNLSVVINEYDLAKALNTLHEGFFLSDVKTLNLFMIGVGLIGGTLLRQLNHQYQYLIENQSLKISVIALGNTRKMHFDEEGIDLQSWKEDLESDGVPSDVGMFVKKMKELNLQNALFVDCTSSQHVVSYYEEILNASISIATPNKLATSGDYALYKLLQQTASRMGVAFRYETNVGAGLPVINTLNDLKISGDKIIRIEGVLSGTLSYIFNNFKKGIKFSQVVREAKAKGYTEPDPRDDLSGTDVARKILILAREVGYSLEVSAVEIQQLLPTACLEAPDVEGFFKSLEKEENYFDKLLEEAEKQAKVLRFIARMEDGKARVSLELFDESSPFYTLSGSDNMITFVTERYKERPLVIKGPGAGAEVTAAGVFADIVSISHFLG